MNILLHLCYKFTLILLPGWLRWDSSRSEGQPSSALKPSLVIVEDLDLRDLPGKVWISKHLGVLQLFDEYSLPYIELVTYYIGIPHIGYHLASSFSIGSSVPITDFSLNSSEVFLC